MKASIIIPTRNRATLLENTLEALALQLKRGDEIIVVNNNSQDQTAHILRNLQTRMPIVTLKSSAYGPSAARNLGFQHAKHPIIVFLDDDCIVQPKWRDRIERDISQSPRSTLFQGKITNIFLKPSLLDPLFETRNRLAWREITTASSWKQQYIRYLNAGNMYFHRQTVQSLEILFDSQRFPYIGEETDLAYRLQTAGKFIKFSPGVSVVHYKIPSSILRRLKHAFMLGRLEGILIQKYLANQATKKLFSWEMKSLDKGSNQFLLSMKIIKNTHASQPLTYIFYIFYLILRDTAYYTGKISAFFSSKS